MARHAGFAVVASVGEAYVNQTLWAAFMDLEPVSRSQLFPLPASVPLADGSTARLSGVALFEQRPTVSMKANPANTVSMEASAVVYVSANTDLTVPVALDQTWKLRLAGSAAVAVDVEVAADGVFLRWVPGGTSLTDLDVAVLEGPGVPAWLIEALNSNDVRAAMTRALQAIGPVRISSKLIDRTIRHTQPGDFRQTNFSVFEWFTLALDVSRVALRVKDGSISVGVDFAGLSAGADDRLVDLFSDVGDGTVYRWPIFDYTTSTERPLLVGVGPKPGVGDIAVLFNSDVLGAIVGRISTQIAGTPIAKRVTLNSIALRPDYFDKPLRGREIGLRLDFAVTHQDAGAVSGQAYLQPFLAYDAESGPSPFPSIWALYVAHVVIDVPWWVDVSVALAGVGLALLVPPLTPLVAVGVLAALGDVVPTAVANVEAKSERALGRGTTLAAAASNTTLPTAKQQPAYSDLHRVIVGTDGIGLHVSTVAPSVRFAQGDSTLGVAVLSSAMDGGSTEPYVVSLALRDDLASLGPECTVQLVVQRADTGAEVARRAGPYETSRTLAIDHLDPDLYFVDAFFVSARIWLNRVSMTGLLFASDTTVAVTDSLDRHHPFLTWAPHWAHFMNPGTGGEWWHRLNWPRIHRTAASARCLALHQRIERRSASRFGVGVEYSDTLPFAWEDLPSNRAGICDYCFFGGETRSRPFPREDWFRR